ncbi:endolytic transglycosylase MltG [Marininema halotolerans]|uniref:Endolytic murein transglycosylase n=1 Tax=Marininema halotolerans TaxID=1155944 RepID=A0A1I6U7Z5_9BACL|nr:endolytic transglycosylase MltG [Marininema halotolerans]SFS97544.1 UPF0755 protein [Marininema halotolerans]
MKWILRLLLTLFIFAVLSAGGYAYIEHSLSSPAKQAVEVEVPMGASILDVGKLLEKKGLIRDDLFFAVYAYLKGEAKGIRAGMYEVPPNSSTEDLLSILTHGENNVMRITVPEGTTVNGIAYRLEKKGIQQADFLRAVNRRQYPYQFVQNISKNSDRKYLLEGYLFPITYNLPKKENPEKLVDAMLRQFAKRLEDPSVKEQLQRRHLAVDQWVTIASIVEREGLDREELPRIAGVIENRLRTGKKLQVDATVQYALGKQKSRLLYKDLKVKSPYNTYLINGLPPGPIANPGDAALHAALYPEKHSYLFYVTRKDGSGRHYFARTEAEHEQNIKKSKQQAKKH